MLSMRDIRKEFNGIPVLKGVDLDVASGELRALLGANGAGKSTLIKILGGQYPDANGAIELDGRHVSLDTPRAALETGIGIVHQEFELVPELSVAENIYLGIEDIGRTRPSLLRRCDRKHLFEAGQQLLQAYGIQIDARERVARLAPSQQQLVQIARVLALQSNVMVFDEPTARLGKNDRSLLFELFAKLKAEGKKLIFVTHYLDEVVSVCDTASVMRDGLLVRTIPVSSTNATELSHLMVGSGFEAASRMPKSQRGQPVLTVSNLSSDTSFTDVSFQVGSGEILGLVGHVGSGRHELTRCVVGAKPSRGSIVARNATSGKLLVKPRFGFIAENRREEGIFPELSIAENISVSALGSRMLFGRLRRDQTRKAALQLIEKLQIKTIGAQQKIKELSGGNQQKVLFGRALLSNPDIFVIEAPTVGVDVKSSAEIHAQIFRLADGGAGVIVATDDLEEALTLCDRVLVMFRGRIAAELADKGLSMPAMVAAMGSG